MTLGAHGDAATAPAVARDDQLQAREQKIRGANNSVESGLAGAVAIIEEVLGERVVDGDDRELQRAVLGHGAEADDAGGGFFGAADDVRNLILALGEKLGDEVGAIVHGDLGFVVQRRVDVRVIGGVVLALDGVGRDAELFDESGCGVVLRRKRIRAANHEIGAAVTQRDRQVGRLGGDVETGRHANALERLFLDETLADQLQHGHVLIRPFDLALALFRERKVLHIAFYLDRCFH